MRHEQLSLEMLAASVSHHSWQSRASVGVQTEAGTAPVNKYIAPASTPDPAVYPMSTTVNEYVASAPVIEYVAPAPLATFLEPPVPIVHVVQVPQVQVIEKIVEIPVAQTAQDTQTPESLGTVPVHQMKPAETVDMVEVGSPLSAVPVSPLSMTAPVVDVSPVVVECAQPALVFAYIAPAPAVTHAALAPVAEDNASTPSVAYAAEQASVVNCIAPAPDVSYAALAPVVEDIAPAPAVTSSTPVCVGDTGFDTWWSHHCEVIRIGDRHFEGEIRVLYAPENPDDFRSGRWIPTRCFRPDGKRARLDPEHLGKLWTVYEMATAGSPGRYTNTGHMTEPGELVVPFVLARDFDVAELQVLLRQTLTRALRAYPSFLALLDAGKNCRVYLGPNERVQPAGTTFWTFRTRARLAILRLVPCDVAVQPAACQP